MKRVLGIIGALVLLAGMLIPANVAAQNTNNFKISSFDVSYELSKDENGRSVLETTEVITARFPSYDQNHGLIRAIPKEFDGHTTDVKINSVTNSAGESLQYSKDSENDMMVLKIGDPDEYVRGLQTYKISYTQHDVTKYFEDTGRDEWYWDTNGTQWDVPIEILTVRARIDESLVDARVGDPQCYEGITSSTDNCAISSVDEANYFVAATDLSPGENVTIALGFSKDTFAGYAPSLAERLAQIWIVVFALSSILAVAALIALSVMYYRRKDRTKELHTIVTEYIPPKNASVLVSSQVITPLGSAFSAQLIDLAVRHFIEIIETKEKAFWTGAEYDIKIITDVSKLPDEEKEILSDMFGHVPALDERLPLKSLRNDTKYYMRTSDNDKKLTALIEGSYAIREKSVSTSKFFYRWSIVLLVFGVLTLSPITLIIAGIVAVQGYVIRPLTDKGLELRRYLEGLKKYIKAAEVDRIKFLQGPDTAQKIGESVDVKNPGQLVKLYERVLPYAILFGLEKDWSKRLGEYYESAQTSPDWYSGNAVFNAVVFSSAMNSFSLAASYSGGSSSSSSGGSSGGGSSGGGGGGGGGGGW